MPSLFLQLCQSQRLPLQSRLLEVVLAAGLSIHRSFHMCIPCRLWWKEMCSGHRMRKRRAFNRSNRDVDYWKKWCHPCPPTTIAAWPLAKNWMWNPCWGALVFLILSCENSFIKKSLLWILFWLLNIYSASPLLGVSNYWVAPHPTFCQDLSL